MTEREVTEWDKNTESKKDGNEYVSIYKHGRISIPKSVYTKHFDGEEGAKLQFAENTEEIGIVPVDKDDPNAYLIDPENPTISCKAFLEAYELLTEESKRFAISEEEGTIWVDTAETLDN